MYDIGMVYKKKGHYYLAIDSKKLITFHKGKPLLCRSRKALQKAHSISVRELCIAWNISLELLDRVADFYLLEKQDGPGIFTNSNNELATAK